MPVNGDEANEEISYSQATERLEEILDALERGEVDIDELAIKVKEAAKLLKLCKDKIERTQMEVEEVAQHLENEMESDTDRHVVKDEEISPGEPENVPF